MHDHGAGGAHAGAWVNVLPLWLHVVFVGVLCLTTAWSVLETVLARKGRQVAGGLHVLVGVGMLDMYTPWVGETGRAHFWQIAFGAATGLAALGLLSTARNPELRWMWRITLLDVAAMAYMFLLFDTGTAPLTYVLVGVYALVAVGWLHGALDAAHRPLCGQLPAGRAPFTTVRISRGVRAAMSAAMAWMFLAMTPQTGGFVARAFTAGFTEDTWWALALIALLLRAAADPALVRRLVGTPRGRP